jgi:uncharacterized membrane protein YiaA
MTLVVLCLFFSHKFQTQISSHNGQLYEDIKMIKLLLISLFEIVLMTAVICQIAFFLIIFGGN